MSRVIRYRTGRTEVSRVCYTYLLFVKEMSQHILMSNILLGVVVGVRFLIVL